MAAPGFRVTVTTSATRLDTQTAGGMGRSSIALKNMGGVTVDLGSSTVTAGAGYPLAAGESLSLDLVAADAGIYGAAASGSCVVAVLQVGG